MGNHFPKILGIIPARGGSKRLPGKNIKQLKGKPLIAWSIECAKGSELLTDVIVSTDDKEIADCAKSYGASVPFLRPDSLATDQATSVDVLIHAIEFLKQEQNKVYDYIVLLQPTSPLRRPEDIDGAIKKCIERDADTIISLCEVDHPPEWAGYLGVGDSMAEFFAGAAVPPSVDQSKVRMRLNGSVFVAKTDVLLEKKNFYVGTRSFGYVMPKERSIDIDTEFDFKMAEAFLSIKPK